MFREVAEASTGPTLPAGFLRHTCEGRGAVATETLRVGFRWTSSLNLEAPLQVIIGFYSLQAAL